MSDLALGRIRRFSQFAWIAGAVVIAITAFFVVPQIARTDNGGFLVVPDGGGERIYPQYQDDPVELTMQDGSVSGDQRGGWIPFPADAEPMVLRRDPAHDDLGAHVAGADYINVFQSADEALVGGTRNPVSLYGLWDTDDVAYALPALTDGRLWFSAIDPEWTIVSDPIKSTPIVDGAASGTGDAMLSYRGDALSAKLAHTGSGFLRVTVFSPEFHYQREPAVNDVDDFQTRTSWAVPGTVLFKIESTGGEWSVTLDE